MKIYPLLVNGQKKYYEGDSLNSLSYLNSISSIVDTVKTGQLYLQKIGVDDIINCLSRLTNEWSDRNNIIQKKYPESGINYLIYYFKQSNLENISNFSLRGDRHVLDDYTSISLYPYKLLAQPRGLICHWLSGNIPILGMISIIQGLITKNANIIKISKHTKFLIPDLLQTLKKISFKNSKGQVVSGKKILESIAVIYIDKNDNHAQKDFSESANVRVAWGGKESIESVINLPRKYTCDDVILGPKTSFVLIGSEFLSSDQQVEEVAKKVALDASLYEQRGCNSPHTVFIERGGKVNPEKFAEILARQLEKISKLYPFKQTETADTQNIILQRTKYDMTGLAFYPSDLQWTVLFGEKDEGLAIPCFNRTLFVRPIKNIFEVEKYCSYQTQSIGVALSPDRKEKFAKMVTSRGIDRCPDVGNMLFYDTPWDGMFIMDRFVRWSKI